MQKIKALFRRVQLVLSCIVYLPLTSITRGALPVFSGKKILLIGGADISVEEASIVKSKQFDLIVKINGGINVPFDFEDDKSSLRCEVWATNLQARPSLQNITTAGVRNIL